MIVEWVVVCSGAVMEELAMQLLGVWDSGYTPTHTRNLANQFKCYVNYKPETLS